MIGKGKPNDPGSIRQRVFALCEVARRQGRNASIGELMAAIPEATRYTLISRRAEYSQSATILKIEESNGLTGDTVAERDEIQRRIAAERRLKIARGELPHWLREWEVPVFRRPAEWSLARDPEKLPA